MVIQRRNHISPQVSLPDPTAPRRQKTHHRLTYDQRCSAAKMRGEGMTFTSIARELGCHPATVKRALTISMKDDISDLKLRLNEVYNRYNTLYERLMIAQSPQEPISSTVATVAAQILEGQTKLLELEDSFSQRAKNKYK